MSLSAREDVTLIGRPRGSVGQGPVLSPVHAGKASRIGQLFTWALQDE